MKSLALYLPLYCAQLLLLHHKQAMPGPATLCHDCSYVVETIDALCN